jgi:hypothetical protein
MLGKVTMEGRKLIDRDVEPCPYKILTSMGKLKKTWKLIKLEIVIQINPNKLAYYTIMQLQMMVTQVCLMTYWL